MSKILKQVVAAFLLLAADPALGQPLAPAVKAELGGTAAGAARALGNRKESGTVLSTTTTLISILESAPAAGRHNGIIGPLAAGPAAGIASASGTPGSVSGMFSLLIDGFAIVAITTGTVGTSVSTTGTP